MEICGGFKSFMRGFSLAPIVELSSGRPFNILAVGDANGDFQSTNERPTVLSDGKLCATALMPVVCKASFRQTDPWVATWASRIAISRLTPGSLGKSTSVSGCVWT